MANPVSPAEVKQAPAQNPVGFGGSTGVPAETGGQNSPECVFSEKYWSNGRRMYAAPGGMRRPIHCPIRKVPGRWLAG